MKVIKPGRDQTGWAAEIECTGKGNGDGGCGAILLVEENDFRLTYRNCRDESETFTTFKCCQCGVDTDFQLPSTVEHRVIERERERQKRQKLEQASGS
jgi:hypothetical protein